MHLLKMYGTSGFHSFICQEELILYCLPTVCLPSFKHHKNSGLGVSTQNCVPTTRTNRTPKTNDLYKKRPTKFDDAARHIGQVTIDFSKNPICIPVNSVITAWVYHQNSSLRQCAWLRQNIITWLRE